MAAVKPFIPINLDAAHADVDREQDDGELKQPLPKIHRLKGFFSVTLKWIVSGEVAAEQFAAADFGQALQPRARQPRDGRDGEGACHARHLHRAEVEGEDLARALWATAVGEPGGLLGAGCMWIIVRLGHEAAEASS